MNGWLKRMEIADEQIHPDFTSVYAITCLFRAAIET
jgi:hypothetical protein